MPRSKAQGVGFRFDGKHAGWSNLCQCGSVWCCPVHAAKIGAERATDIAQVIRYVIDEVHGSVLHVTLTARHDGSMSLEKVSRAVADAWAFVGRHRWWKVELDRAHGRAGFVRAMEVTWGKVNGWHPHLHVLLFLERPVDAYEAHAIGNRLREVYTRGLGKSGLTCSVQHGVKVEAATTRRDAETVLSRYVTKIAHEVTRQDRKTAKTPGQYTPFELFAEVIALAGVDDHAHLHARLLAAAEEYERTMTGRQQLTWSGKRNRVEGSDIRSRAGLRRERTNEEIAAADDLHSADMFRISSHDWFRVVRPYRMMLVELAEVDGVEAVLDALDVMGVEFLPVVRDWPDDVDRE